MKRINQYFARMSQNDSTDTAIVPKNRKQLILTLLAAVLLVALVIGVVNAVKSRNNDSGKLEVPAVAAAHHAIIKTSCSSTLYPDLCFTTLATALPQATEKVIRTQKDVIELSLNITITAVQHNYLAVKKLIAERKDLTPRQKAALHDCLETNDETRDELHQALENLQEYPDKKSLKKLADDLITLMSSAITKQETCIDSFSHDEACRKVRQGLLKGLVHVEKLCSCALAMIKSMTDTGIVNEMKLRAGRKLEEEEEGDKIGWPDWLSAGDRRLLQSHSVTPHVVVAADGSGNYTTVAAAVAAAPDRRTERYVIRIKAGAYKENFTVPSTKHNIMFMGDGATKTIITEKLNVVDNNITTYDTATVAVVGRNFLARDITFQNTAGPSKDQAVALRVNSDHSAFYKCAMLAYQDTLYVHSNRQFFVKCFIAGTIDFIFGNGEVVLQDCDIKARRPNPGQKNMVTAQGRTDPNQNTGIVIQKCRIGATHDLMDVQDRFPTFLGRPWKEYSRTVVMQSWISDVIDPAGWHEWNGNFALDTLFYGEYQNTGPGADTSRRVKWKGFKVITDATEAQNYTVENFIGGGDWLPSAGFPFSLGL